MIKNSRRTKATSSIAVLALLVLAACGSDSDSSDTSDAPVNSAASATTPVVTDAPEEAVSDDAYPLPSETPATDTTGTTGTEPAGAASDSVVAIANSEFGGIMTDANGLTLYGFTNDVDGVPTCNDGCAGAWPAVLVDASFDVSTLPAEGSFSVVERDDGTTQLKAGKWPLYTFSGDAAAGDTNGQGSGDVWFVVADDASLVK